MEENIVTLEELITDAKQRVKNASDPESRKAAIFELKELEQMRLNKEKETNNYDVEMAKVDKMEDRSGKSPWYKEHWLDLLKVGVTSGLYIFAINRRTKEKDAALQFEATGEYNGLIRSNAARNATHDERVDMPRM